jgi:signal transduction histidine kinase
MIESVFQEITEHQKTGEQLRKRTRDLSERVKDLNCLYAISGLVMRAGISFDKLVQEIVDLIPGSWHHPEVACARIVLQDQEFKTENFRETVWKQVSDIAANDKRVGTLEVCYLEQRPEADEGPFMKEDRNLIDAIAERMGRIIEQKQADKERDKLESQLMQASKMSSIGEMAAGVAHEINNPVAVILGFAELLLERFPEDSKEFEMLKTIERQGDNCKRIVDNLLAFARVPKEVTTETDVAKDLQKVANVVMNTLLTEKVDLKIDVEEDLPRVGGDRQQLEQVFLNLINNAVTAMDEGGILTISAHRSDDRVNIEFNDTGHGISPEHIDKIFEPFFTTRKVGEGTGLGLSVSYAIVKKFGGDIQVKSQTRAEGKDPGTTFIVTLPIVDV